MCWRRVVVVVRNAGGRVPLQGAAARVLLQEWCVCALELACWCHCSFAWVLRAAAWSRCKVLLSECCLRKYLLLFGASAGIILTKSCRIASGLAWRHRFVPCKFEKMHNVFFPMAAKQFQFEEIRHHVFESGTRAFSMRCMGDPFPLLRSRECSLPSRIGSK